MVLDSLAACIVVAGRLSAEHTFVLMHLHLVNDVSLENIFSVRHWQTLPVSFQLFFRQVGCDLIVHLSKSNSRVFSDFQTCLTPCLVVTDRQLPVSALPKAVSCHGMVHGSIGSVKRHPTEQRLVLFCSGRLKMHVVFVSQWTCGLDVELTLLLNG